MEIKKLDQFCKFNNMSVRVKKIRQFKLIGRQFLITDTEQYWVGQ